VQARTHNTANEIQAISGTGANWVDPTYDPAGNMISGPQPRYETADANTQWYKYDAWNRLTKVSQGSSSPGTTVATYSYDGQNRRIRKVVEAGENDITYDYYYNESWQVLEVRKGADADAYQQYVWGLQYIDAPVVSFLDGNLDGDVADAGTDSTLYYTYDGNFNVTAVIGTDGTVAERYTYDPYGQVTFKAANWSDAASQAKSAYDNEILYCGYRFDPESGNYQVRRRYLTPPLGRWLTTDLVGYGDGMNRYQYVGGRVTNMGDPSGTVALMVALSVGGTVLQGGLSALYIYQLVSSPAERAFTADVDYGLSLATDNLAAPIADYGIERLIGRSAVIAGEGSFRNFVTDVGFVFRLELGEYDTLSNVDPLGSAETSTFVSIGSLQTANYRVKASVEGRVDFEVYETWSSTCVKVTWPDGQVYEGCDFGCDIELAVRWSLSVMAIDRPIIAADPLLDYEGAFGIPIEIDGSNGWQTILTATVK